MPLSHFRPPALAARSIAAILACFALGLLASAAPPKAAAETTTMTNYTDPSQALQWGTRSQWKQPWRSYLDTVPATTLLNSVGINFNVSPRWAASTAQLLADSGFQRARIEVGWGTVDYENPGTLDEVDRANLVKTLTALRENGIRPLILLNSNEGAPCPLKHETIVLTAPAAVGATEVHLEPSEVAKVIPGRTGISERGTAARYLITSIDAQGTAELSAPLASALAAGPLQDTTLLYEPFGPAPLADGSPNPRYQKTLEGWLNYVGVVTREVREILGSTEFDVEVWNEVSFGSRFLNINGYYQPPIEWRNVGNESQVLAATVAYLRDPVHGVSEVGIGNGFATESPWWNGSKSPVGLTAIDKHPYAGWFSFPAEAQANGNLPLNALGEGSYTRDLAGQLHELFTPTYDAFFPEYFLSGIQTETLAHDLSPETSLIAGAAHGRFTHPEGGAPPQTWITEVNLGPGSGPTPRTEMSPADIRHVETKDILRYLVAYVNKGVTAIDFYAAKAGDLSLVSQSFFDAAKANPTAYPGDPAGGETMEAVGRLTAAMQGAEPIAEPRSLSLEALTDFEGNVQFEGNGTAADPPLYNREVFAFLPFQVNPRRFVIPVYVMTRNVAEDYDPSEPTNPARFDLQPEPYAMKIGGVQGESATVSALDPVTGESLPVEVISGGEDEIEVEMEVTDSPRLLIIEDDGSGLSGVESPVPVPVGPPTPIAPPAPVAPIVPTAPTHHRGSAGASPAGTPAEPVIAAKPKIRLIGTETLLEKGRLQAIGQCKSDCALTTTGQLRIGPRIFDMRVKPQASAAAGQTGVSQFELGISRGVARLARAALRKRVAVSLTVTMKGNQRRTASSITKLTG